MRSRFNVIASTAQGTFIVNRNDLGVGAQLLGRGAYDPDEVDGLRNTVRALRQHRGGGLVVLDIGANIGVHAVSLGEELAGEGMLHAFEAQRMVFNQLAGNVALASLQNVHCHHLALGREVGRIEIPQFDYGKPLSFGSVEFGSEQREYIGQARQHDPKRREWVPMATLDSLGFPRIDLIKLDVEGMEVDVIEGGRESIARDRPIVFVEYLKADRRALAELLRGHGYTLYVHHHNWLAMPPQCPVSVTGLKQLEAS